MDENISVYDVLDENKTILNSQVLIGNVGFEIPSDYYFNHEFTSIKDHIFHLVSKNDYIRIHYEKCNEENYNLEISNIKERNNITEDFTNYRGQKIIEYENETGINLISYDNCYVTILNYKCKKYSNQYYTLYYILFSFVFNISIEYDNVYYQKNNYCIMKNGCYLYEKYNKNIIKYNPADLLNKYDKIAFCDYLNGNIIFDTNFENYYTVEDNEFIKIFNKINSYVNFEDDNPDLMEVIEE